MEIGIQIPHTGTLASRQSVSDWVMLADQAGIDSVWGFDHIVMPRHVTSKYTVSRRPAAIAEDEVSAKLSPNFELVTTMAFVAAITERVKIGSAVSVLTLRNAVLNARQVATVDRYCGGRVLLGVGVGWMEEEARAMSMPWQERGLRSDEHIELLRAIWTAPGPHVEFHGRYWDLPPMDPEPRPVQQSIPILVGGHSRQALDRAARLGDGWITGPMSATRLAELLPLWREACKRQDRRPDTLPVYARGGRGDFNVDELRRYEEQGIHSLQVDIADFDQLRHFADEVVPKLV